MFNVFEQALQLIKSFDVYNGVIWVVLCFLMFSFDSIAVQGNKPQLQNCRGATDEGPVFLISV